MLWGWGWGVPASVVYLFYQGQQFSIADTERGFFFTKLHLKLCMKACMAGLVVSNIDFSDFILGELLNIKVCRLNICEV